ncbi:Gamma-secretase subunit PEN-2 [Taenia crassiceps]|uniref:Gamma-secretase subunit PEN-2 n=1 Tax=Taenia crassiceps TaxID=6207 RepID=A0ABR4QHF7_9CEST
MESGRSEARDRLRICKTYFLVGIAFLPSLWLVNIVWFFKDAFFGPSSNTKKKFQLFAWNIVYRQKRISWGYLEDVVQTAKFGNQRDQYNYFVSVNKKLTDQIFMCKNIVDRLVDPPWHADPKRKSLWIHAAGGMAIERASEIALHLCNRFYPNQLHMFVYTDTLNTEEEFIRVTSDGQVVERTAPVLKPTVHIRITVAAPSSSKDTYSLQLNVQTSGRTITHVV